MKYKILITKEVELPEYGKIDDVYFQLSHQRTFRYGPNEFDVFTLNNNEVHYETIFGWGVDVDVNTLIVVAPENPVFLGKKMLEITKDEYGKGDDLVL